MARLSPITVSLWTLLVSLLVTGIFLIAWPRHQSRKSPPLELTFEPALPSPEPPIAIVRPPPPEAPVPSPVPMEVPTGEIAADSDASSTGDEPSAPTPNRRVLLTVNHNRRLTEADEHVFEILKLPDPTRASIRQLNQEFRKRTEAGSERSAAPEVGEISAAINTRQDALRLLLGAGPAKDFDAEERAAVQRLRGKYRFEWGRQLRQ